nr:Lrp/AsnC ligand binding domain-containing protein [Acinetobacter baumannii]
MVEAHLVTGAYAYLVKVPVIDAEHYDRILHTRL